MSNISYTQIDHELLTTNPHVFWEVAGNCYSILGAERFEELKGLQEYTFKLVSLAVEEAMRKLCEVEDAVS